MSMRQKRSFFDTGFGSHFRIENAIAVFIELLTELLPDLRTVFWLIEAKSCTC